MYPRAKGDGRSAAIDSQLAGGGRQIHMNDVGAILERSDA